LLTTIISVAGQYAALGVITLTVYTSNTLFVKCDSRQQPIAVALACECTTLGYFSIASGCWYQYCIVHSKSMIATQLHPNSIHGI